MPYAAEIQMILSWWAIGGFFLTLVMPRPGSRKKAALMIFVCGPFAWLYLAGFATVRWIKS